MNSKQPASPSKDWGELKHGDEITVWTRENKTHPFVKLRFECYYGASSAARAEDAPRFSVIPRGEISDELDISACRRRVIIKRYRRESKSAREEKENATGQGVSRPRNSDQCLSWLIRSFQSQHSRRRNE